MSWVGKKRRLERIMGADGATLIIPIDHGFTVGSIKGAEDMKSTVAKIIEGKPNAILLHRGVIKRSSDILRGYPGLIMHLSGGTNLGPDKNAKVLVAGVLEAVKMDAAAVSIHINVGSKTETKQFENAGKVVSTCDEFGMPLLIMSYPRGPNIKDSSDPGVVAHTARLAYELGADVIKTSFTEKGTFKDVVRACSGVPVVMAGGSKKTDTEFFQMVADAMKQGAAGVAAGRNVFQHKDPNRMIRALMGLVHKNPMKQ
jgi:fructose-bisphosphate aldolase/2-amino-3,7-dideoxy-D-threo-hept-6-ulosonate synthase